MHYEISVFCEDRKIRGRKDFLFVNSMLGERFCGFFTLAPHNSNPHQKFLSYLLKTRKK